MSETSRGVDQNPLNTNQPNDHRYSRLRDDRAHHDVSHESHASGLFPNQTKHPRYRGSFRIGMHHHPAVQPHRVFARTQYPLFQRA